ncbi:trifunctional nucleotide phosphoesterase protein YfkN-like isoform X2 [Dreissena polymorpha]|uniref:trifunctional nucleotide phosphoesterase protein YfkN-like isoform X2 n=1 Tax=Dreissena polymorpha TaxID=45954 RepID=UPI0022649104|nr:trifunctional nucleotide phosphoesterase protein YfkN-like isoform X2 [Dreissena polymorpha]
MELRYWLIKLIMDWNGVKVGLMGLVESEWIDTLSTIDPADIIYEDFVIVGNRLAKELRDEGADIVVALTHMRWPNDRRVAQEIPGVDIVLGGHDHDYGIETVEGKYVLKSGTDFRNISRINVEFSESGLKFDIQRVDFFSSYPEDETLRQEIHKMTAEIDERMNEHLGCMGVSMDGRFASIRAMETNLGNFITDIILEAVPADICLMNSGTFRSDRIHNKGEFQLRDLMTILPMVDPLVVIEVSGRVVLAALENGVSQVPKLEGRFPQVAGLSFVYDASKNPGSRVESSLVKVQEDYLDFDKTYRLCTKEYIASGKDGYDCFKDCPVVVESEQCPTISTAIRNHFESVQILLNEKVCRSGHRQSLCSIIRRSMLIQKTVEKFMKKVKLRTPTSSLDVPDSSAKDVNANAQKEETVATNAPTSNSQPFSTSKLGGFMSLASIATNNQSVAGSPEKKPRTADDRTMTAQSAMEKSPFSYRRDSNIGDAAHLAHLAKVTQAFKRPLRTAPKKLTGGTASAYVRQMSIEAEEDKQTHLCPKVEGRIVKADEATIKRLLAEKDMKVGAHVLEAIVQESNSRQNSVESLTDSRQNSVESLTDSRQNSVESLTGGN